VEPERPAPLSKTERAVRTENFIKEGTTDIQRWAEYSSLASAWDARAKRAANFIDVGMSVLDVGCGAMALRQYLKPNCKYTPADVVARSADCIVVDMNKKEFPSGHYDWVTMLGVLEYIHDLRWPLVQAVSVAPRLLVTYCCDISGDVFYRRGLGWVNEYRVPEFLELLGECGWTVDAQLVDKRGVGSVQMMFVCRVK